MKLILTTLGILGVMGAAAAQQVTRQGSVLYNPYERPKNGPPLNNVFYKVEPSWLLEKLRKPKHHPSARMASFEFSEEEALDVIAYLKRIAEEAFPQVRWPTWTAKEFDAMDDAEIEAMRALVDRGKAIWGKARCTICHVVNGPRGSLIGGFVDLRTGGMDLQIAGTKLRRDWLYTWIKEPKGYFPSTFMPRYRFADDEIKALVEYILRDDTFRTSTNEKDEENPERWRVLDESDRAARGKRLIELSRCVICHDVGGIPQLLSLPPEQKQPAPERSFEFLAYDLRCLSCHSIQKRGGTYAPDLTGEGSRLLQDWVADFLESPDMIRPLSQQMPKFNLSTDEARVIADSLARRQETRIPANIPGGAITSKDIQAGRELFQLKGCIACHTDGEGQGGVVGPDLAKVGDRLRPGYLWFHLQNPHGVNPYSAEPDYGLSEPDARALAVYLWSKKK